MDAFIDFITQPQVLIGIGVAVAVYIVGLSLILAIWTARDARRRSKNFLLRYGSPLFVLIFGLIGFFAYVLLRPSKTMKERKTERLERELLMEATREVVCPGCKKDVDEDLAFCPHCKVNFSPLCECGASLENDWKRCGHCGVSITKEELEKKKYRQPEEKKKKS